MWTFYLSQLSNFTKEKTSIFKRINYFATLLFGLFLPLLSCKKQVTSETAMEDSIENSHVRKGVTLILDSKKDLKVTDSLEIR